MVDIIRRKDVRIKPTDVSTVGKAQAEFLKDVSSGLKEIGSAVGESERTAEKQRLKDKSYQKKVADNIEKAQEKFRVSEQKAFDASDKLVAADMAGRLENDLLRWNLEQRQNNPNYIGTPDHEKAMRDYYAKLSEKYSQGLGEVGKGEFTSKTQNAVNQMIGNDVKWAYQQKIKQGENSAKNIAESMNQTASMYGANGDIEGFKESLKDGWGKLKDYSDESMLPDNASKALQEVGTKSAINFHTAMAQTNPKKEKELLENPELFKETVPEEIIANTNTLIANQKNRELNDRLAQVETGLAETKQKSPAHKELEQEKKRIEKELKQSEKVDYTEQSLQAIHKQVADAVKPVLEKSLGEDALVAKQEHEANKTARFREFLTLPTPENLQWFEKENQMSYTPNVENMSEIPEDIKTKKQRNDDLIKNMMKYRENFGNVSMVEISDAKGTKQMFDDLKKVAQTDEDKDGNVDNILLKSLVALNNAKQQEISSSDYNNYENIINKALWDKTFKNELNQFMNKTENFMPKQFWNKNSNVAFTSNRARLNEKMEAKSRDVLSAILKEWNKGMSGADAAKMYRDGIQKAYNDVVSDALGINMEQILADYKEYGFSLANINGKDYSFNGIDSTGNPIWKPVDAHGMSTQKFVESARKVMNKKGE